MIKIKMLIMFIFCIMFLTGCGANWDEAKKEYEDVLSKNPACIYFPSEFEVDNIGIEKMILSANNNGFYVSINNNSAHLLFGADGGDETVEAPYSSTIKFGQNFLQNFANKYKSDSKCPNSIYIYWEVGGSAMNDDCRDMGTCYQYDLYQTTITTPEGTQKDCHYSEAINCKKIYKKDDQYGNEMWLEFGYYKTGDGTAKKYFGVANNEDYKNMSYSNVEDDLFMVTLDTIFYQIASVEAIEEIWLTDNKFISEDELVIKATVYSMNNTTYYISGKNSFNHGTFDDTGTVEQAPDIDPGNYPIEMPEINLNPTEQNCTTLFGSPETPGKPAYYMQIVFEIIKYAAIVLLIVLSIMDYVGAVASSDQDAMKKATTKMVTRLIICVVLFVLPTLLKVIFQIAGIYDAANCGIK